MLDMRSTGVYCCAMGTRSRGNTKGWPDWERSKDQELWDHYARQMIEPGWAGRLSPSQLSYIRAVLTRRIKSPYSRRAAHLRRRWGFPDQTDDVTETAIQEVAMWGDPDDPNHNARLVRTVEKRRPYEAIQLPFNLQVSPGNDQQA